jgi:hypothetical protein
VTFDPRVWRTTDGAERRRLVLGGAILLPAGLVLAVVLAWLLGAHGLASMVRGFFIAISS